MNKTIELICILSFVLIILTGCTGEIKKSELSLEYKIQEEIEYIEYLIFKISNKYAKGEYLKDDSLDWDEILKDERKINDSLDTIVLDLSEKNVENEEILKFSNQLNNLIIVSTNKNEESLLTELANLYYLLPGYFSKINDNHNEREEKEVKSLALRCFANANIDNWDEATNLVNQALEKYLSLMNNVDYIENNSYKMNKIYVLIGELKNAVDIKNIDLVKLKFVTYIENS